MNCPDCNQPWEAHEFGAPKPFCPEAADPAPTAEMYPEDFCRDCGRENPVWHADNMLWNSAMRDGSPEPIICPCCFIKRAEAKGVHSSSWRLSAAAEGQSETGTPKGPCPMCNNIKRHQDGCQYGAIERETQQLTRDLAKARAQLAAAQDRINQLCTLGNDLAMERDQWRETALALGAPTMIISHHQD